MKVLYIDHYAGSPSLGMEFRPHLMARHWAEQGVQTTILAGSYAHLRTRNPDVHYATEVQVIDGVEFMFIPTPSYEGNGAKRVYSMLQFVASGLRHAGQIVEKTQPNAVIASSTYPFDTYLGQRIASMAGARLVHEIHDLWPLTPMELGGMSKWHPFIAAMAAAEKSAYRNSDAVVSILPNTEPYVRSLGITTPVIPIPNGIETTVQPGPADAATASLVARLHAEGKKVIGYAGGLALSNAMEDFVAAMAKLAGEPIAAVVIGDGVSRSDLEAAAARGGADIHFVGSIPKSAVHATLQTMDALYIGSRASRLYEYGVSANKIFDYLLTGVPIVNAFATSHSPLTYVGTTVTARAEDPDDIARAIREACSLDAGRRREIAERQVAYVREHHDYAGLARQFLDVLRPQASASGRHVAGDAH